MHRNRLSLDLIQKVREDPCRRPEVALPELGPATRQLRPEAELRRLMSRGDASKLVGAPRGPVELRGDHLRVPDRLDYLEQLLRVADIFAELAGTFVVLRRLLRRHNLA